MVHLAPSCQQPHAQQPQPKSDEKRSIESGGFRLWMGELDPAWDEQYILGLYKPWRACKVIIQRKGYQRNKQQRNGVIGKGELIRAAFVEFEDEECAFAALAACNGKPIADCCPGSPAVDASSPSRRVFCLRSAEGCAMNSLDRARSMLRPHAALQSKSSLESRPPLPRRADCDDCKANSAFHVAQCLDELAVQLHYRSLFAIHQNMGIQEPRKSKAGWQPSLEEQLDPLGPNKLRERLIKDFGACSEELDLTLASVLQQQGRVAKIALLLSRLCADYQRQSCRQYRKMEGRAVPHDLYDQLLQRLRETKWELNKRKLDASEYLTLRRPWDSAQAGEAKRAAAKLERHRKLWNAAAAIMDSLVTPPFEYTSMAITKNFVGSPHIDQMDRTHQFAISLGEFSGGGRLCVEASANEVLCADTQGKLACIDGRYPHWVSGYDGERFSIIYFKVDGEHTEMKGAAPLEGWVQLQVSDVE